MTGESILLVDTDRALVKQLKRALAAADYEVETAHSAEEGLTRAVETPTAIALIGVGKDSSDALELTRKLASESPQTQCILLCEDRTALDEPSLFDTGNVFSLHQKPITQLSGLGRDIGRAMEIYFLRRQNARLLVELRDARDDLRSQFEFLAQCEKLAALGQVTWDFTDDIRSTLQEIERCANAMRQSANEWPSQTWTEGHCARIARFAEEVQQVSQEGRKLVNGIDLYAKGEDTGEELIDLRDVVQSAFGLLGHRFSARGVRVKTTFAGDLPPILANPGRLKQAIAHIAVNAVKAMPTGGTIAVSALTGKDESGGVSVRVKDSGIGIDPEALPNIFDPFFTTRPPGEGTGLGLYIAREIVREHGGEILVESAPGRGSEFTITLPVAVAKGVDEDHALPLAA